LCVSSLDWDAMWTSKQQIMHRLAMTNRILYMEEPVTMLAPLKVPSRWNRWRAVAPVLRQREAGLWTLTPPPVFPFGNMRPSANRLNQAVLGHYAAWGLNQLGFGDDYIFWSYLPASVELLSLLRRRRPPGLAVYHCVDEHSAFPGFVSPEVVRGYDDRLTRETDLVITTAENLRVARQGLNPHTYTVLNAADVDLFNQALDSATEMPADLACIPSPRLGVVGLHDSRLDLDALEVLATADPSWHIVLIGPLKTGQVDEARLKRHPNIHLIGEKPREQLPRYLKGMSIALIPYKANELTRNIFPLKLFEYLAAGLPVVAGGLPELRRLGDSIGLAERADDYPGIVRKALRSNNDAARAERVALAAGNSWERRVEEISHLVEQALGRVT